jgi:hypothetical protein
MIIFRPHRGSLDDAMKEAKEFKDESEMKKYIVDQWNNLFFTEMFTVDDIVIDDKVSNDDRNGWKDTRYVCTKRMGNEKYDTPQCIGMCATDY